MCVIYCNNIFLCTYHFLFLVAGIKSLLQSYKSLQQAFNEAKTTEGAETCGSDLYVQCAEIAYKVIFFINCYGFDFNLFYCVVLDVS